MVKAASEGFNEGVSNSIAQLVEKSFLGLMQNSKEGVGFLSARYSIGFEKYISNTLSRCLNVKTLISTNHPVLLYNAYEPVDLIGHNDVLLGIDKFIESFGKRTNAAIISATLGAGKSFTMKYIYSVWARSASLDRVPIFVELRYVNFSEQSLVSYITQQLSSFNNFVTERSVHTGLKNGAFALVLDGFDEIPGRSRAAAEKQILRISQDYPDTYIVISSRPDINRFLGWSSFSEYRVSPLTLQQLERMINRIEYDEGDKTSFLRMIKKRLFKTHERLLSNPLLASMMLLTFREFQDIPSKMHVFYGTAFDVLFRKHDTTKAEYHREFATGLDLDDFKRLFMTFCFTSYVDKRYSFDEALVKRYAEKALLYEDISAAPNDFQHDVIKNICIMHQEGETISFIHRSFQEYFTALFLSKRSIPESYEFVEFIINESADINECIQMLIDIDSEEFERKFLIKRLTELDRQIDSAKSDKEKIRVISDTFIVGRIEPDDEESTYILVPWTRALKTDSKTNRNYQLLQQLFRHYEIAPYSSYTDAESGWWEKLPKKILERPHLSIIGAHELSLIAAKKAGLVRYVRKISPAIKRILRELGEKHERKRRLLSNSLKRTSGVFSA
jgi:hypothetical protein